ncbi:MAG: hypothetical protein KKF33_20205, partial [Alphaproteobacteria bacterium]|nr:hypothetical protein [Alphaproteobacteria bacterium]
DLLTGMAFAAARAADNWFADNAGDFGADAALALNQQVLGLFAAMLAPAAPTSALSPSLLD